MAERSTCLQSFTAQAAALLNAITHLARTAPVTWPNPQQHAGSAAVFIPMSASTLPKTEGCYIVSVLLLHAAFRMRRSIHRGKFGCAFVVREPSQQELDMNWPLHLLFVTQVSEPLMVALPIIQPLCK